MSLPSTRVLHGKVNPDRSKHSGIPSPIDRQPRRPAPPLRLVVPSFAFASRSSRQAEHASSDTPDGRRPLTAPGVQDAAHRGARSDVTAEQVALDALASESEATTHDYPADAETAARLAAFDRSLQEAVTLSALGNSALLPLNSVLSACGISRDVGERLRESGELRPVVVKDSKNPKLYVTLGAWRRFVESRSVAPPPSKSKLSRAKQRARRGK